MIGLHPCSVKENYEEELKIVNNYIKERSFIAIGEIGLDFYWDVSFREQQFDAFQRQIETAVENNIPIAIHSRNAINECIEVVQQYPELRGVFHCFSGDVQQARQIIDCNFMLGIGGVVTFKNAGLDKVINEIGMNNVILETDAPYLAPVPFRGKRNEPAYTKIVAEKLSDITGTSVEEIE
jgi:TatD DNase family protein